MLPAEGTGVAAGLTPLEAEALSLCDDLEAARALQKQLQAQLNVLDALIRSSAERLEHIVQAIRSTRV